MSVRGNTSGDYFGEWFGLVEVMPGAMTASIGGSGGITADLVGVQEVVFAGGGAIFPPGWYGKNRKRRQEVAELEELFESAPLPVKSAIAAQSRMRLESMEADERAIRAAAEAARIEWDAFYMRLLAYQREEALIEEEAIVMTMFAVLSE